MQNFGCVAVKCNAEFYAEKNFGFVQMDMGMIG
jgi:hypothetical protein